MSLKSSIYDVLTIINKDGDTADFRLGAVSVDFYESILCPTISVKINVANTGGTITNDQGEKVTLYEGMKIRGGEQVALLIKSNSDCNEDIDYSSTPLLYVKSIKNIIRKDQTEFFTLHLVSLDAMRNEVSFLQKAYPKDVKISDHVENIIKEFFPQSEYDIESTANTMGFIGNQKKPFEMITKLASKSVSEETVSSSAGFFFYQTRDGFKFKSIDGLISQKIKYSFVYSEVNSNEIDLPKNSLFPERKILKYQILGNQDVIANLRNGTYAVEQRFFDPLTQQVTFPNNIFGGASYLDKINTLGNPLLKSDLSLGGTNLFFTDFKSNILTENRDVGTIAQDEVIKEETQFIDEYMAQRKMRYNTLFTQRMKVDVPLNTMLRAGDIVECVFPKLSIESKYEEVDQISGLYMIKELCHHFEPRLSMTSMTLVRDTFGERIES